MIDFRLLVLSLVTCAQPVVAQMRLSEGIIPAASLPAPVVSQSRVLLDVPHIRQDRFLCVPTSAAMILAFFGEKASPTELKALAENHKPPKQRHRKVTYWNDMQKALRVIGKDWAIRSFHVDDAGFAEGLDWLRRSLRAKTPVMIDMHIGPGHTFVAIGFDDQKEVLYVRDPDIPAYRARAISYAQLRENWHSHKHSPYRYLFEPKR